MLQEKKSNAKVIVTWICVVCCSWFTHFYMVGSIVNSVMFVLVISSYVTSSALPFIIATSVDILNIGLKQHVVSTGKILFFSCLNYILYVKLKA